MAPPPTEYKDLRAYGCDDHINQNEPPSLLRNDVTGGHHWVWKGACTLRE